MAVNLPRIDLPAVGLPTIDQERVAGAVKDAAYIAIGFGVLTVQRAQVRRQELIKTVGTQLHDLDERFAGIATRVDGIVEQAIGQLPDPAGDLLGQAQKAAISAREQLRTRLLATV